MKSFLILIFCIVGLGTTIQAQRGPATQSSVNRGQSYRSHDYNPNTTWVDATVPPPAQPCFEDRREWIPGGWQFSCGRRIWVPGRWGVNRVDVPCPPPPMPVAPSTGCFQPTLSPEGFSMAMQSVQNRGFESSRMTIAREIVMTNCLTSVQVRDLLTLFSFESSRLELAKHAYHHTVDKNNYYLVNDAFRFESSVRELGMFIQSCRH